MTDEQLPKEESPGFLQTGGVTSPPIEGVHEQEERPLPVSSIAQTPFVPIQDPQLGGNGQDGLPPILDDTVAVAPPVYKSRPRAILVFLGLTTLGFIGAISLFIFSLNAEKTILETSNPTDVTPMPSDIVMPTGVEEVNSYSYYRMEIASLSALSVGDQLSAIENDMTKTNFDLIEKVLQDLDNLIEATSDALLR